MASEANQEQKQDGQSQRLLKSLLPRGSLTLRRQAGYGHSFFFVFSFTDDHLCHHAAALLG